MPDAPPPRDTTSARYWTAAAISSFGTAITAVAMPVLVVQTLDATPVQVGIVNAAQFLPYAVFGLVAGVYVDRWRRKPVLVWGSVGRALALGAIPVLWLCGALRVWALVGPAAGLRGVLGVRVRGDPSRSSATRPRWSPWWWCSPSPL